MRVTSKARFSAGLPGKILTGMLLIGVFFIQPASAEFDYIFFSVNGDTTLTSMTQGDQFFWASNCDTGATINWEIWYDADMSSTIDPMIDVLLNSENITDGSALSEWNPVLDGWVRSDEFRLSAAPGDYIFRATDIVIDSSIQRSLTMVVMPSPPNRFTGEISLPGVTPPNSLLANRLIFGESESEDAGVALGITDTMGQYSMNIGASGTGLEFYLMPTGVEGFVEPGPIMAIASGVVGNNDFAYTPAVDSVWGFVKDESGTTLNYETSVDASSDLADKFVTTKNGRYVIYFSDSDKGDWGLESSSQNSPIFVSPDRFYFSHDTLGSFQYDITLIRSDAIIYARVTENGGLPVNNYLVNAYSFSLGGRTEAVSGTGSDNIAELHVSSLDPGDWDVSISDWDDNFPVPPGFVIDGIAAGVAPGDTVTLNLINGHLISGSITQDPEDGPIDWYNVYVGAHFYGTNPDEGGFYSFYTDTGNYYLSVYADGYVTNPEGRFVYITGDTTVGLDFVINRAHCRVSGALTNLTLPLDSPYYNVIARTGTDNTDGYYVYGQVDMATGTYEMDLCDGDWTIIPPSGFPDVDPPESTLVTIGESPDTARTIDFEYTIISTVDCGNANGDDLVNVGDVVYLISYIFREGQPPDPLCSGDANGDGLTNVGDAVYLISFIFREGLPPVESCCF